MKKNNCINLILKFIFRFIQLYLIFAAANVVFDNNFNLLNLSSISLDDLTFDILFFMIIVFIEFRDRFYLKDKTSY